MHLKIFAFCLSLYFLFKALKSLKTITSKAVKLSATTSTITTPPNNNNNNSSHPCSLSGRPAGVKGSKSAPLLPSPHLHPPGTGAWDESGSLTTRWP